VITYILECDMSKKSLVSGGKAPESAIPLSSLSDTKISSFGHTCTGAANSTGEYVKNT
jgi:hypothetical protein